MIATKKKDTLRWRWLRWVLYFFGVLLLATILCGVYLAAGVVGGVELDATAWKTRNFQFFVDPFTDTQLTYIYYDSFGEFVVDPLIAPYLVGGVVRPANSRWDMVSIYRSVRVGQGDARILLGYLQSLNVDREPMWVEWTKKNTKAAPVFWGAVRDAVHLQRYDRLHAIFEAARATSDSAALKVKLDKIMLDLAIDDASRHRQSGDAKAAQWAAKLGLAYGDSNELKALIDESDSNADEPKVEK